MGNVSLQRQLMFFPLALLCFSAVLDLIASWTSDFTLRIAAFYILSSGVFAGGFALILGWMLWLNLPQGSRRRRADAGSAISQALILSLFICSFAARKAMPEEPSGFSYGCSLAGALCAVFAQFAGDGLFMRLGQLADRD